MGILVFLGIGAGGGVGDLHQWADLVWQTHPQTIWESNKVISLHAK